MQPILLEFLESPINEKKLHLTTLVDILRYHANSQPHKRAYLFLEKGERETDELSYHQLWQKANIIASYLQNYQGERALLLYTSGLEFITAFFGCLLAGVVAVPVYPPRRNQKLSRLLSIIEDASSTFALSTESIKYDIQNHWAEEPGLKKLNWLATDSASLKSQQAKLPKITPDTLAFLQYTSGSTGKPKGVMVSHRNLIDNEEAIAQRFGHINYIAEKLLPKKGKYKSPYFQELAQKNIHFVTKTQGFFNGYQGNSSRFLLQFIVENWGSSPFLACNFYGVRYFANLILKNYEHKVVKYYKKQKKQGESLPIPTAISYYHFLDEAFHTTTSLFISRDLYRQLPPPSAYEKLIANLGFYFTQCENFASLSAILPNRFTGDRTLLPYAYQLLQSPVFEFSPQEALHWLEKCLCQEHEGFHNNLNLHQHLLNDCRHFTSKLDYLWSVNREMRLMVAGGSIGKAIAQNKKAFQQFAKSI